jgi:cytochrome c-type biogenesis protein CcmH/NrfG
MANASTPESAPGEFLQARQVYTIAAMCLAVGLGIGYLSRGFERPLPTAVQVASSAPSAQPASARVPTLDDMKKAADKQAAQLLEKLKANPNDSALLTQVAAIYHGSHQFKEAAGYYEKALQADPKNVSLRTKLASSLYRSGDVDGAIAQLKEGLRYDPGDANSLFNLGMISLQGKGDGKGALAAWQKLLKSNPQMSAERKAEVQKLMADVLTSLGDPTAAKGAASR